jgi:phosphatidylinositol alpha-1,6-mannosyltransferase
VSAGTAPLAGARILALVTDAFGTSGGIAQYNRDLIGALSRSNAVRDIVVLSRSAPDGCALPAKVTHMPARAGKWAWAAAALRAAAGHGSFDVVFGGHLFSLPVAACAARLARAQLWAQLHGIEAWQLPSPLQRSAAESADLVTAVSRHTRRRFLSWASSDPQSVKVLPNTVDQQFSPGSPSPDLQDRYRLHGRRVLLTVSRLSSSERYKGHDHVLRALALLAPRHPEIVYVVAGDGDDRGRLEGLAASLGVAENTRFVGHVADAELPGLFRTCDAFVMPSTGEGFGIVFLQALACGKPVIAGNSDGSVDPLREGAGGILLAPDSALLASAIERVLHEASAAGGGCEVFARQSFDGQVDGLVRRLLSRAA